MAKTLISLTPQPRRATRRGGFTLIEILVAVAIMSLLLGIILVPLRLGFETYHIGKARAEVQQEAQLTLQQFGTDLRRAKFVFPNSAIPGVSNNQDTTSPCSTSPYNDNTSNWKYLPYVRSNTNVNSPVIADKNAANYGAAVYGVCDGGSMIPWSNTSRIDMLQVRRGDNGSDASATQDFLVTYYPRRLDITKPYDIVDNPVVLFRAQIPFRFSNGNSAGADYKNGAGNNSDYNADIDWTHYPSSFGTCTATGMNPTPTNRSFSWITHNLYGEANLEPLATDAQNTSITPNTTVAGAHTLATPLGMGLVAPRDINVSAVTPADQAEALVPELSFSEEATKGSRINRVTVDMTLALYDQAGAGSVNGQGKAQRVHVSQTFDVPNAGCTP